MLSVGDYWSGPTKKLELNFISTSKILIINIGGIRRIIQHTTSIRSCTVITPYKSWLMSRQIIDTKRSLSADDMYAITWRMFGADGNDGLLSIITNHKSSGAKIWIFRDILVSDVAVDALLLLSLGNQQPYIWVCRVMVYLFSMRNDINYLRHLGIDRNIITVSYLLEINSVP